jgi:hypothetical protein
VKLTTTTHQPLHLTPDWILAQLAHERNERIRKRFRRPAKPEEKTPFSIRQFIARAEKLNKI